MMGFIDQMRAEGHAVESTVRVLREQGVRVAARTYRAWRRPRIAARTISDAMVVDAVRCLNQFPWRYGVSDTLSPDSLVTGRPSPDFVNLS